MGDRMMHRSRSAHVWALAAVLSLVGGTRAAEESVKDIAVEGRIRAPVASSAMTVHLNGGKYRAFVRKDGSFSVPAVPAGAAYLLEVVSANFVFDQVRVSVMKNGDVRASLMYPTKRGNDAVPYPLFLEPRGKLDYFEVREGFNFGMLYKNPMVLMMGFSCLMMFMMKYMIDPEQMKEMQAQMADEGITSQGDMLKAMMKDPEKLIKDKEKQK